MVALKSAHFVVGSFVFCSWSFAVQAQTCEKNEDCGANNVCFVQTFPKCSGGASSPACAPNEKCEAPEPEPTTCVEVTAKLCVPRYVLPCTADTDCGDGFTCEPNMVCTCSGSGGSGSSDPQTRADAGVVTAEDAGVSYKGAFAPVPTPAADGGASTDAAVGGEPPACECHPLDQKHCVAKSIKCQSDSECPSDFACISNGSVDCAIFKDADAAVCGVSTQSSSDKLCVPRYNPADYASDGGSAEHGGSTSTDGKDVSEPPTRSGGSDAGVVSGTEQDAGTMPAANHSDCSVATPGASKGSTGFLLGFVLLALGIGTRKRTSR